MLNRRLVPYLLCSAMMPSLHAGMTAYDLNDVVKLRLEDISFFVLLLVVSGVMIRALWNVIANAVPLPKLPYKQAMALTVILSLGMLLVLSMISGARELLTPGAWRRQGSAYKLNAPENEPIRLRNIVALKTALFDYAEKNQGKFPPNDWGPEIHSKIWEADLAGTHFIYVGGLTTTNASDVLIAVEPISFGQSRYVLTSAGEVKKMEAEEITRPIEKGLVQ